eukprot:6033838-Pyramimonas_sp.AAC.1
MLAHRSAVGDSELCMRCSWGVRASNLPQRDSRGNPSSAVRERMARRALRRIVRGSARESAGRARQTARSCFSDRKRFKTCAAVFLA